MIFKNILVPFDESSHALSASPYCACDGGRSAGGEGTCRHHYPCAGPSGRAVSPGDSLPQVSPSVVYPESYDQLMEVVVNRERATIDEAVKESLRQRAMCQVVVDAVVSDSSPVEGIANYVEGNGIDLVGGHGAPPGWVPCAACSAA